LAKKLSAIVQSLVNPRQTNAFASRRSIGMARTEGISSSARSIGFDWRVAVTLMVIVPAIHVLNWALLPFVLAAIVAFLCDPVVRPLTGRTGLPRWLAGPIVWLIFSRSEWR
jgi:hypothetical protein